MTTAQQMVAKGHQNTTAIVDEKITARLAVIVSIAAANRDDTAFDGAGDMVLDRKPNLHVAFGAGPHSCLGQALALTELQTVLGVLLMVENITASADADLAHPLSTQSWAILPVFLLVTLPILWRRRNILAVIGVTIAASAINEPLSHCQHLTARDQQRDDHRHFSPVFFFIQSIRNRRPQCDSPRARRCNAGHGAWGL